MNRSGYIYGVKVFERGYVESTTGYGTPSGTKHIAKSFVPEPEQAKRMAYHQARNLAQVIGGIVVVLPR